MTNWGKGASVHKRHMKARAHANARASLGRTGVRHAKKVRQQDKRAAEHNSKVPMDRWIRRNRVR